MIIIILNMGRNKRKSFLDYNRLRQVGPEAPLITDDKT